MKKIILHVGPPKTGTTAIQGALSSIADDLKKHGIFYPETMPPSKEGHPSLAWEILEKLGKPVARLSKAHVTWDQALSGEYKNQFDTLLVSSEDFTLLDEKSFIALRKILSGFHVTVIFGLRDPLQLVPSIWQQSVRWGMGCGEELLDINDAVPFIINSRINSVNYLRIVQKTLECEVRAYIVPSGAAKDILFFRFAEAIALPPQLVAKFCDAGRRQNANKGLSYQHLGVLLQINKIMHDLKIDRNYNTYEKKAAAREAILQSIEREQCVDGGKKTNRSIPLSSESREMLIRERDKILEHAITHCKLIGSKKDMCLDVSCVSQCDQIDTAHMETLAFRILARSVVIQASRLSDVYAYLSEVEKARDWWKTTSEKWEYVAKLT